MLILYKDESDISYEVARSLQRAISFLNNGDESDLRSFEKELRDIQTSTSIPPLILIADSPTPTSSLTPGFEFLRKYWARLIKKNNPSPYVVILSFEDIQALIKRDPRHIAGCADGCEVITIPFSLCGLLNKARERGIKKINSETIKTFLLYSCQLGKKISEHDLKNYSAPFSLFHGCYISGELSMDVKYGDIFKQELGKTFNEELKIWATASGLVLKKSVNRGKTPEDPLYKIVNNKRILLVDDEHLSAGWSKVLSAIMFPKGSYNKDENAGSAWVSDNNKIVFRAFGKIEEVTNGGLVIKGGEQFLRQENHLLPYDFVLLDLYLIPGESKTKNKIEEFSGIKVLRKLRELDESIPVILFTASNKALNLKEAEKWGIDGYFPKETYVDPEEAKEYYQRFKDLIKDILLDERRLPCEKYGKELRNLRPLTLKFPIKII